MSTTIVTLPTTVTSGLPYFPTSAFSGRAIDVKRTFAFDTTISKAASGRETAVSWREMPEYSFELDWNFVDDNDAMVQPSQSGAPTYTELATLIGFFQAQHGQLLPFYLRLSDLTFKPGDSLVTGQQIAIGDAVTTNFQLCRTVGSYLEPLQMPDPAGAVAIYVNGAQKTVTTDYTILPAGIVQFTAAPALNAVISADIPFVYLCRFDADDMDVDQWAQFIYECKSLKLRTVIQ
jgi:uncharacterized protein (TIGR02217 family)